MLSDPEISGAIRENREVADFVQQLFDLLELLVRQSSRMNTFDLPSKVFKLGWVRRGRKGEGNGFDGHYTSTDSDILVTRRDRVRAELGHSCAPTVSSQITPSAGLLRKWFQHPKIQSPELIHT